MRLTGREAEGRFVDLASSRNCDKHAASRRGSNGMGCSCTKLLLILVVDTAYSRQTFVRGALACKSRTSQQPLEN